MAKKPAKAAKAMKTDACATSPCYCKIVLAIIIIVLAWWKPAVMWSQIVITIAALIILLTSNTCMCKKSKPKK